MGRRGRNFFAHCEWQGKRLSKENKQEIVAEGGIQDIDMDRDHMKCIVECCFPVGTTTTTNVIASTLGDKDGALKHLI